MTSAWTCRLRTDVTGLVRMMLIPAAGSGFSEPCCADGHSTAQAAAEHGAGLLVLKLTSPAANAA